MLNMICLINMNSEESFLLPNNIIHTFLISLIVIRNQSMVRLKAAIRKCFLAN